MKSILVLLTLMLLLLLAAIYGMNKEISRGHWCADEAYNYVWCKDNV